jgi:ABC-type multidrug transport system ATPase subunit
MQGADGVIEGGKVTAVFGSSGAGKTVLFTALRDLVNNNGSGSSASASGKIFFAGSTGDIGPRAIAFVPQADVFDPESTVKEAIIFSARCRLPSGQRSADMDALVMSALASTGLEEQAHKRIKSPGAGGLSAADRRRLSITMELVSRPSVLVLDEPLSLLDVEGALQIAKLLQSLSRRGLAIACSIHQPSVDLLSFFDAAIVVQTGGHIVYCGPIHASRTSLGPVSDYFGRLLSAIPSPAPSVTSLGSLLSILTNYAEKVDFVSAYTNSEEHRRVETFFVTPISDTGILAPVTQMKGPGFSVFGLMLARLFRSTWRNPWNWGGYLAAFVAVGLLIGATYYDLDVSTAGGIQSLLAMHFMLLGFAGMIPFAGVLQEELQARPLIERELGSHYYSVTQHLIARLIAGIPLVALGNVLFLVCFFFLAGSKSFGHYFVIMLATGLAYSALGLWISAMVQTASSGHSIGFVVQSVLFLFSGLFVPKPTMPKGWIWLFRISPLTYAADSVWLKQAYCDFSTGLCPSFSIPPTGLRFQSWFFVRELLGLKPGTEWTDVAVLIAGFTVAYTILSVVSSWLRKRIGQRFQ